MLYLGRPVEQGPTEEVFTMPHKDKVDGVVRATKPLSYAGTLIEDFSLTFERGRVVRVEAGRGQQVLQQLVGVDDVEVAIGEGKPVGTGDAEAGIRAGLLRLLARLDGDLLAGVHADDQGRCEDPGEVHRDRARPAAHVEQAHPRSEVGEEVGGGVRRGPPPMGAQDALVVAVGVDGRRAAWTRSGSVVWHPASLAAALRHDRGFDEPVRLALSRRRPDRILRPFQRVGVAHDLVHRQAAGPRLDEGDRLAVRRLALDVHPLDPDLVQIGRAHV